MFSVFCFSPIFSLSRYCTRLGQAQTEEDKTAVLEDMRNTPEAQAVLEARKSGRKIKE